MITALQPTAATACSQAWCDVEVVDGVLVDEVPRPAPQPAPDAGLYDASGRPAGGGRFGRRVSVLA